MKSTNDRSLWSLRTRFLIPSRFFIPSSGARKSFHVNVQHVISHGCIIGRRLRNVRATSSQTTVNQHSVRPDRFFFASLTLLSDPPLISCFIVRLHFASSRPVEDAQRVFARDERRSVTMRVSWTALLSGTLEMTPWTPTPLVLNVERGLSRIDLRVLRRVRARTLIRHFKA